MKRAVMFLMGLIVAVAAAPQQSFAQYECNMCDSGCGQVSPCAGGSCGTLRIAAKPAVFSASGAPGNVARLVATNARRAVAANARQAAAVKPVVG